MEPCMNSTRNPVAKVMLKVGGVRGYFMLVTANMNPKGMDDRYRTKK
jgi:hypothetical protein